VLNVLWLSRGVSSIQSLADGAMSFQFESQKTKTTTATSQAKSQTKPLRRKLNFPSVSEAALEQSVNGNADPGFQLSQVRPTPADRFIKVQPRLTIGRPDDAYEQEADPVISMAPATTLKIQRQATTTAALLSSAQIAQAISFYRSKPDLYPSAVINKIQHAVKSPETGVPDSAMVQGVAQFQSENVLKVDGMAGPRTLPRLFESGLATESNRKQFVAVGKAVEANWTKLATPEARKDELAKGIESRLDEQKVPKVTVVVGDLGNAQGLFEPKFWKITIDRAALSPATITDDDARALSGTFYHEARHAEQHHKMARMLATKGNTAEQIHAKMGIPIEIAKDAFANKLPRDIEFATAAQQFDSVYGTGKAHHDKAEAEAPSITELRAAQAAAAADPSPTNKAKAARLLAAYKAYHDLPTENDAFATGTDFEASWDEATDEAKSVLTTIEGANAATLASIRGNPTLLNSIQAATTDPQFARVAALLILIVPAGVVDPVAARTEALRILTVQLANKAIARGSIDNHIGVVIVPRNKLMTDLPQFASLAGQTTFDGRNWETTRGSGGLTLDGNVFTAIAEENLLGGACTAMFNGTPVSGQYAEGYSTTSHEFAHTLHNYVLTAADRTAITTAYNARKASATAHPTDADQWVDGREGCYASQTEHEFFAQLSNAYLGTNGGDDPFTGGPRHNSRDWVRTHEPTIFQILERMYSGGSLPGTNPHHP
jgi:peptidoglycan hydrolase-like protein with peptidoglycan-binding domain